MKVYVDELPKSCKDCFFCEHIEENVDGKGRDEVACYFEGFLNNVLLGETFNAKNCKHLQSLSEYTKQVRKEVCEEIKSRFLATCQIEKGCDTASFSLEVLNGILDQIQGEIKCK